MPSCCTIARCCSSGFLRPSRRTRDRVGTHAVAHFPAGFVHRRLRPRGRSACHFRRSGVMAAWLDGKVDVKVDASPERIDVEGKLRKGRIELTTNDIAAVQVLDPNPEITFVNGPEGEPEESRSRSRGRGEDQDGSAHSHRRPRAVLGASRRLQLACDREPDDRRSPRATQHQGYDWRRARHRGALGADVRHRARDDSLHGRLRRRPAAQLGRVAKGAGRRRCRR